MILDNRTRVELAQQYPIATRSADAGRLGFSRAMLDHICTGRRRPDDDLAQRISAESGGVITVARLRRWQHPRRAGCRFFDTDPMPPHRVSPDEPFRDRYSAEHTIRYLREIAADLPPDLRIEAERIATHIRDLDRADRAG